LRNNYFEGKRLTPDMFRTEQRYLNERRRMLNRAVHGWGVVYGFPMEFVDSTPNQRNGPTGSVDIGAGLALDQCGRELVETGRRLTLDQLIVLDDALQQTSLGDLLSGAPSTAKGGAQSKAPQQASPKAICALITAHYAEQSLDAVRLTDACRCERHEWDHVCETVRYSLRIVDCEECCRAWECELCCRCGHGACCEPHERERVPKTQAYVPEKQGHPPETPASCETLPFKRGGCRCLCDHLMHLHPGDDCDGRPCEIEEACGRHVRVDVRHGVPLACVRLGPDACQAWTIVEMVDDCGPRRLVKRNDLLFDLIRGCDLTRIVDIGWPWHRAQSPISFEDFQAAFGTRGYDQDEYVSRDFWVRFSKPVRASTLDEDCFAMLVISGEREGKWWQAMRVPIRRVAVIDPEPGDPADTVRGARLVVDGGWAEDALWGRGSVFHGHTRVEIEIRGDFILDCNGQPVDADAVGRSPVPSGNGSPGGLFLSTFQVAPRKEHERQAAKP
jgi:hypothetical protein